MGYIVSYLPSVYAVPTRRNRKQIYMRAEYAPNTREHATVYRTIDDAESAADVIAESSYVDARSIQFHQVED